MFIDDQNKLVSIVLCTFNGGEYLKTQIDSLINQTYRPIEILILDDLSTDNTFEIAQYYAANYSYIKCFKNEINLGINENMAKGFKLTSSKYICPCDQDDFWYPEKIEKLVKLIESTNVDLVYCDAYFTDENLNNTGIKESDKYRFIKGRDARDIFIQNCVSGHSLLFNRRLLEYCYPFSLIPIYYDYWLVQNALIQNGIDFIDEPLVLFRRHNFAETFAKTMTHLECQELTISKLKCLYDNRMLKGKDKLFLKKLIDVNESVKHKKFSLSFFLFYLLNKKHLLSVRPKGYWSNVFYSFKHSFKIKY